MILLVTGTGQGRPCECDLCLANFPWLPAGCSETPQGPPHSHKGSGLRQYLVVYTSLTPSTRPRLPISHLHGYKSTPPAQSVSLQRAAGLPAVGGGTADRPSTLNPRPSTLNPQPQTLDPEPCASTQPSEHQRGVQAGAEKTLRAAEAGMGATVGLAAKGILPDSSVPSTSSRGPATPVQDASLRQTMTAPRAIDSIGMTVLPGVDGRPGFGGGYLASPAGQEMRLALATASLAEATCRSCSGSPRQAGQTAVVGQRQHCAESDLCNMAGTSVSLAWQSCKARCHLHAASLDELHPVACFVPALTTRAHVSCARRFRNPKP